MNLVLEPIEDDVVYVSGPLDAWEMLKAWSKTHADAQLHQPTPDELRELFKHVGVAISGPEHGVVSFSDVQAAAQKVHDIITGWGYRVSIDPRMLSLESPILPLSKNHPK